MHMSLTHDETVHIAKLAKLPLTSEEVDHYAEQLSPIVDYFNELSEVDVDGVEGTSQTTGLIDVLRPDEVDDTRYIPNEEALGQAKITHNGYFSVPPILSKDN